ncbi:heavy-metal-associated domain-containing protein [Lacipirellula parvula]|nr:heavy-metal-associated domain-containing protein [Lacipirellula parvula]
MKLHRMARWARSLALLAAVVAPVALNASSAVAADVVTYEITADDMCCQGCAKKIAAQLYTAPGVMNVSANVEKRLVTVTAKPSPKLTADRLWNAVEKGKGKPSRLVASDAAISLVRPDQLDAASRATDGRYVIAVTPAADANAIAQLSSAVQSMKGVQTVTLLQDKSQLIVEPAKNVQLSPWPMLSSARQLGLTPSSVTGPFGRLTLETTQAAPQVSARPQSAGGTR